MTKKQVALLAFVRAHTEEHGFAPSYREIAAALGMKSVSAAFRAVSGLVARGELRRRGGVGFARTIEIVSSPAIPDGWALVPKEPTMGMRERGANEALIGLIWAAMVEAAPKPPGIAA